MGNLESVIYNPAALVALGVAGVVGYGYAIHSNRIPASTSASVPAGLASGKKSKKKKAKKQDAVLDVAASDGTTTPKIYDFPTVIPGGFEPVAPIDGSGALNSSIASSKGPKKKKGKKAGIASSAATAGEGSESPLPQQLESREPGPSNMNSEGPWTRIEPRKRVDTDASLNAPSGPDVGTSTGTSSPVTERSELEELRGSGVGARGKSREHQPGTERRTLAEKLLPKPRKTKVDDMLEDGPPALSRVIRVAPRADEHPPTGFSWGDYEDVDASRTADDAKDEDDCWDVVKRSKIRISSPSDSTSANTGLTTSTSSEANKKQRQNAARREAEKNAKVEAERARLATLATHKRELERERIKAQAKERDKASRKEVSGGMKMTVDAKGKLVWE